MRIRKTVVALNDTMEGRGANVSCVGVCPGMGSSAMRKVILWGVALGGALAFGCATQAQQGPMVDIGNRHGNLRQAQENIVQAWHLVSNAQEMNDSRLGGHAANAKRLLEQANDELRLAADVANENERR